MLAVGLLLVVALYLAVVGIFYANQRAFLFIGSAWPSSLSTVPNGYRDVRLAATDGTPLRAWYKPPAPGQPVVLFFHGNGDTIVGSSVAVQPFVAQGYGVLLPEFRGYGGMPGKPSEALVIDDARRVLGWLTAQGFDGDDIVLIGYSLGSGAATHLASEFRPRALILFAAFASVDRVAAATYWFLPVRLLLTEHFDNASKLPRVTAPTLLLHGTADTVVPYDNMAVLARARPDATTVTMPRIGHEIVFQPSAVAKALAWLDALSPGVKGPA